MAARRKSQGTALVVAAAVFGLVVAQVAAVGAKDRTTARVSTGANLRRKLRIVNRRLNTLSRRVKQLEQQLTAIAGQGPTGGSPSGPAGGALTGADILDGSLGIFDLSSSIPAVRVTNSSVQGVLNATYTLLQFNEERYDTAAMHSEVITNSRLTAPATGIYELSANLEWEDLAGGTRSMVLVRNGEGTTAGTWIAVDDEPGKAGGAQAQSISTVARLQAGDQVELFVKQTNEDSVQAAVQDNESSEGSSISPSEYTPEFSMTWLSPGP